MARWLVVLLALAASGCTVDVLLGLDTCDGLAPGSPISVPAEGECTKQCTCGADGQPELCGEVECPPEPLPMPMPLECEWPDEGVVLGLGDTKLSTDQCEACTCLEDGTLSCAASAPPRMECEPSDPTSGCFATPTCGPMGWECLDTCDCSNQAAPYCPQAPTGCSWSGVECVNGFWDCGILVCEGCDAAWNECGDPMIPGCMYEPRCDQDVAPTCELVCNTCMDQPPVCPAMNPACRGVAVCGPMGEWECTDECPVDCNLSEMDFCDVQNMGCTAVNYCLESSWYCADVCGM